MEILRGTHPLYGSARTPLTGKLGKYSVISYDVNTVLAWINSGEIAIPEIQRPFVWDSSTSEGRKVLIDGQRRVTATADDYQTFLSERRILMPSKMR